MSATLTTPILPSPQTPGPRLWTREEFYRLADLGFFRGQRAERIEGQILVLSPQKWLHSCSTDKSGEVLARPGVNVQVAELLP